MSATAAASHPRRAFAPAPHESAPRPVRAVPAAAARRARPKLAYAVVAVAGVLTMVVVQLLLSVGLSHGAYEISSLQRQETTLGWQKQAVAGELLEVSSPQFIAANAQALGMIINGTPAYLRLSDGAVIGVPAAATTETDIPVGAANLVANSRIDGVPLVTVPGASVDADASGTGVATPEEPVAPLSLDDGIPAPQTR
ncbi:hypothetical protein IWX78_000883 [Mycetocola sp. CAN_C7]|uniref:hypothetical protein n=1 Tax=Mycetocola sp. CAN_C7 TaxID=2787724 RepID=UPI0018C99551